ncbi:Ig-like domain-containing protein [Oceanirhabdus sp. W0125-5]|uniref:Ig-like domain-containing protein n=1 Tax=Oceanirhabdus sp. W0125-5 TaxID=2999116 RepID=UPI0022F2AC9F|nr:Ig-like domain-containing protein [Oceanirhabdus sp. W0125-5]WBW99576.1 Ig-like domain-containing protein [Oceanirhabdus sp. W0125-5]
MKRLCSCFILFICLIGASVPVFAESNEDFIVAGNKAFSLDYANNSSNNKEVSEAIVQADYKCYFNINGNWFDLDGKLIVDQNIIKNISYDEIKVQPKLGILIKEKIYYDDYHNKIEEINLKIDESKWLDFDTEEGEGVDIILDGNAVKVDIYENNGINITPAKAGTVKLVAKSNISEEIFGVYRINVSSSKKEKRLEVNSTNISLNKGEAFQLKISGSGVSSISQIRITTGNSEIINVDKNGLIKALKPGNASITLINVVTGDYLLIKVNVKSN